MDNIIRCSVCDEPISVKEPWNPEIKDHTEANFHQFKGSDATMCKHCYEKYKKLFDLYQEVE